MTSHTHSFRVTAGVPGLALRVLLVLVGGAATFVLNPYPLWQWIGVAAVVVGAAFPHTFVAWASVACIALGILVSEPSPVRTAVAVLAIHLLHVLGCLCLTVPARARISLPALRPTLIRLRRVQVIAQPIALLAVILPDLGENGFAWLAPAGALILGALAVLLVRRVTAGGQQDA